MTFCHSWKQLYCPVGLICSLWGQVKWSFYTACTLVHSPCPAYSNPITFLDEETFGQKEKSLLTAESGLLFLYVTSQFTYDIAFMYNKNIYVWQVVKQPFHYSPVCLFLQHLLWRTEHAALHTLFPQTTAGNLQGYLWENQQPCCAYSGILGIPLVEAEKCKSCQSVCIYQFLFSA